MKAIFLLTGLLFVSVIGFSQPRHPAHHPVRHHPMHHVKHHHHPVHHPHH